MSTPVYFPSLSEDGWISNGVITADYLMAQFFESDFSQTQLYLGQVSSLAYLIQKNQNNIPAMMSDINQTLSIYFSRYFTGVYVEVTEVPDPNGNNNITGFSIYVSYKDENGVDQNISKNLADINSKFNQVVAQINS